MIRRATTEDIGAIVDMGQRFFEKSNFAPDYDGVQFAYTLGYILAGDSHYILLAENEGFIIFDVARYYTSYPVAHMFLFYSEGHAGRSLLKAAQEIAKEKGCKYFYASSSAGISERNENVLKAIYRKQGFVDNGVFMRKELI